MASGAAWVLVTQRPNNGPSVPHFKGSYKIFGQAVRELSDISHSLAFSGISQPVSKNGHMVDAPRSAHPLRCPTQGTHKEDRASKERRRDPANPRNWRAQGAIARCAGQGEGDRPNTGTAGAPRYDNA